MSLLEVRDLSVRFHMRRGPVTAIDRLSFRLEAGRTLGIVGESGSGKSVTSLAIMRLLANTAEISSGAVLFEGRDLLKLSEKDMQSTRGRDVAMIFQDPMTSLNPSYTVGFQLEEALRIHADSTGATTKAARQAKAVELMKQVGIPDPQMRLKSYPHQLSGGMSQRVMIAMAIACSPRLLIADEPTTALDVTIQAQILQLLRDLQKESNMALILITHDIGVVANMADEILVMYAGQAVERGPARDVIGHPRHPYTAGLLASLPAAHGLREFRTRLPTIAGLVPDLARRPAGCQMNPRCASAADSCRVEMPPDIVENERMVKCFFPR
ncbi:MAG: ABC transporter ATP-binding protein [Bdellovibrionaceae bacterium]|nr:ABC transporter ATP-binding protein [Pseudobdellovibrionaceae bacterium]